MSWECFTVRNLYCVSVLDAKGYNSHHAYCHFSGKESHERLQGKLRICYSQRKSSFCKRRGSVGKGLFIHQIGMRNGHVLISIACWSIG
jgi:hypothetical protein